MQYKIFQTVSFLVFLCWPTNILAEKHLSIIAEAQLSKWGYKSTQNYKYNSLYCDQGEYRYKGYKQAYVSHQAIRKIDAVARMEIIKEVYPDKDQALARIHFLKQKRATNTKYEKLCSLRKFFVKDKAVYIVYTDMISVWWNELPAVYEKLMQYINSDHL